jgi:hypothetical protein
MHTENETDDRGADGRVTPRHRRQFEELTFTLPWRDHLRAYSVVLRLTGIEVDGPDASARLEELWGDGHQTARFALLDPWLTEWAAHGSALLASAFQVLLAARRPAWARDRIQAGARMRDSADRCAAFRAALARDMPAAIADIIRTLNLDAPKHKGVLVAVIEAASILKEAATAVAAVERALAPDARAEAPSGRTGVEARVREFRIALERLFAYDPSRVEAAEHDLLRAIGIVRLRAGEADGTRKPSGPARRHVA